jgi:hypothetical protein
VRGVEMILLGAKKYFNGLIDRQQSQIDQIEQALRSELAEAGTKAGANN